MLSGDYRVIFEGNNLERIFEGLLVTIKIAFISVIIAIILGILFGVIMTLKSKVIRAISRFYLETMRIIPIIVWLFIGYFGIASTLNINLEAETVCIIIFSLWGIAEMGDLVRGAIESIPKHQIEAGQCLGLSKIQIYRYILVPQGIRRVIPGAINLSTRMIKTTSLIVLIGVVEVVKVSQQIIETSILNAPKASFFIYGFVFILYFIVCYPISILANIAEKKLEY